MKKRLLGTLMTIAMLTTSLMGCSTGNTTSENSQAHGTENMKGKTEVDFWYSGGKTAVKVVQDIVDDYNKSQDKYFVKTVTQADYSETYEKLQAAIAGNVAPDVALIEKDAARGLSDKKLVEDLSDRIKKDENFNNDDYVSTFFEQAKDDKGKIYGIPAYGTTQVLYYNKKAFENAGIDPNSIKTWQDLSRAASKIKDDGQFIYGWEPMWGADNLMDAALSNGGTIFSEDGKKVTINAEEWIEAWDGFGKWIHDDKTMAIHSGGQGWEYWYTTIDDVLQNKAGGYTGSSGDQADLDFSIVGAMEQPGFNDNSSAPTADALQLVMLQNSSDEEKEGVYEFMKYFTTPENQAKWSMGTGYVAVRESTQEVEEFKSYAEENPQALVPLQQASHGTPALQDPTGGKILDALSIAADKVELENVPAQEALDEAQKTAQEALDAL